MKLLAQAVDRLHNLSPHMMMLQRVAPSFAEDVIATLDLDAFLEIRKKGRELSPSINNIKYFNIEAYMTEHVRRAMELDMHMRRTDSVLDIGTGFGYFPYVCEFFGNQACAIDVPGHALFDEVTNFLGIKKTHHMIKSGAKLPDFGGPFDTITGFQVAFHNPGDEHPRWGADEWEFFLDDLLENQVKPKGRIYFELNFDPQAGDWCPPAVKALFKKKGAWNWGRRVLIDKA